MTATSSSGSKEKHDTHSGSKDISHTRTILRDPPNRKPPSPSKIVTHPTNAEPHFPLTKSVFSHTTGSTNDNIDTDMQTPSEKIGALEEEEDNPLDPEMTEAQLEAFMEQQALEV